MPAKAEFLEAIGVSIHARKAPIRDRPTVFGVQWSFQVVMLVTTSLMLAALVAVAVFDWMART